MVRDGESGRYQIVVENYVNVEVGVQTPVLLPFGGGGISMLTYGTKSFRVSYFQREAMARRPLTPRSGVACCEWISSGRPGLPSTNASRLQKTSTSWDGDNAGRPSAATGEERCRDKLGLGCVSLPRPTVLLQSAIRLVGDCPLDESAFEGGIQVVCPKRRTM